MTINMSNNSTGIEFGDYIRSSENRRPHTYIYDEGGESRRTRESAASGASGGDPINSNGDEDIPNLSAIYRE